MDLMLEDLLNTRRPLDLLVVDCALITLSDKAFERKHSRDGKESRNSHDFRWDQKHLGVAFKFAEEEPRWHCVWATLAEYDEEQGGSCVFRSYDDVYLENILPSPRKKHQKKTRKGPNLLWLRIFIYPNVCPI